MLIYSLTGMIPLLLVGFFLVINTRRLEYQHRLARLEEENKRVVMIIFDTGYIATKIADNIFFDASLKRLIGTVYASTDDAIDAYRDYDKLRTFLSDYPFLSGITVYVDNPSMPTSDRFVFADEKIRNTEWYRIAAAGVGEVYWHIDTSYAYNQEGYLILTRKLPVVGSEFIGVLQLRISHNFLRLMISDSALQTLVTLNDGRVFYSYDYNDIGAFVQPMDNDRHITPVSGRFKYLGKDLLASQRHLDLNNLISQHFKIITIDSNADDAINKLTVLLVSIVSVSVVFPFVFINLFSSSFSRRIKLLRVQMGKIAKGDFAIMNKYAGHDELAELYMDMKDMIRQTEALYDEIYSERLAMEKLASRQQEMKYKMLASQINPHFLFNTLESIRMKAMISGGSEVARIIKLLGSSMHHMLDVKDGPVTLESELSHLRTYFYIQEFRFFDRIRYSIDVCGGVDPLSYMMPPLLIQPLVENAIFHGLESKKKDGIVDVNIALHSVKLLISVSDNGCGMTGEELDSITARLDKEEQIGHIGLRNVHGRIKLVYGEEYGLNIESAPGKGTRVTIVLPADWRGYFDESDDNR